MFQRHRVFIFAVLILFSCSLNVSAKEKNGFDLNNSIIDESLILFGGPAKDGIPALDNPRFIPNDEATYLEEGDRVLGLRIGTTAKAYPIRILNWHEVVNDDIDGSSFIVSYCPLCGTGAVFSASVEGKILDFGVSGLLYNSDVLLYDRQTESLWSQIRGQSISGPHAGTTLNQLPVTHTSWQRWREQHPDTLVLSRETGHNRDYTRNPYKGYSLSEQLYFPVEHVSSSTLHQKETVLGISIDSKYKAYPFSTLKSQGQKRFSDSLNGQSYTVIWDEEGYSATAIDTNGVPLQQIQGFWFAWFAFHPTTEIYSIP